MDLNEIQKQIVVQKKIIKDTESNLKVMILGTVGVLTLVIIIGIPILLIAIFWHLDRKSKNKEAKQQLQHLELLEAQYQKG
jgi:heme/copper-type cytochrome/quinol oxidase subunit 2